MIKWLNPKMLDHTRRNLEVVDAKKQTRRTKKQLKTVRINEMKMRMVIIKISFIPQ